MENLIINAAVVFVILVPLGILAAWRFSRSATKPPSDDAENRK